jgi:hypothetical protein
MALVRNQQFCNVYLNICVLKKAKTKENANSKQTILTRPKIGEDTVANESGTF